MANRLVREGLKIHRLADHGVDLITVRLPLLDLLDLALLDLLDDSRAEVGGDHSCG